jgi:hypothetical protein
VFRGEREAICRFLAAAAVEPQRARDQGIMIDERKGLTLLNGRK